MGNVQGSLAKGKKGGVITLIHKHCPYKLQSIDADDMGCRITISLQPQEDTTDASLYIMNLYASNSPSTTSFTDLTAWFTSTKHYTHIIGGDLNSTMCDTEDRKGTKPLKHCDPKLSNRIINSPLAMFAEAIRLRDVWRLLNLLERKFTQYSHVHRFFSRTDYLLTTDNLIPIISAVKIHEIAISDHAHVSLQIKPQLSKPKCNTWKFPSYLSGNADFKTYSI